MYQLWDFLTIPARLEGKKALQIYREPWLLPTFSIMYYIYTWGTAMSFQETMGPPSTGSLHKAVLSRLTQL
jgi:hypothetical protein